MARLKNRSFLIQQQKLVIWPADRLREVTNNLFVYFIELYLLVILRNCSLHGGPYTSTCLNDLFEEVGCAKEGYAHPENSSEEMIMDLNNLTLWYVCCVSSCYSTINQLYFQFLSYVLCIVLYGCVS